MIKAIDIHDVSRRFVDQIAKMMRDTLKSHPGRKWSRGERNRLQKLYADTGNGALGEMLGRSASGVLQQARQMGLRKSPEFMRKHCRFQPGTKPWNTGLSIRMHPNAVRTQFQKGHVPINALYDGVIVERIRRKEKTPRNFIRVASMKWILHSRYVWEQHYGPIPSGHVIRHRDGNTLNDDPANLECISKAANALRNSIQRYPAEVQSVIRAYHKLNRVIRRKDEEQDGRLT